MPGSTNYPAHIDNYPRPDAGAGDDLDTVGKEHDKMHGDAFAAAEAIETELGTQPSGPFTNVRDRFINVETVVGGLISDVADKVDRAGDTMTGALLLSEEIPTTDLEAASKGYVDVVAAATAFQLRPVHPLLSQAIGWWDGGRGVNPIEHFLADLSGFGHDLQMIPGACGAPPANQQAYPAWIQPDPYRGRGIFSPGWDDMYFDTPDPGPFTGLDIAVEGDFLNVIDIYPDNDWNWLVHQGSTVDNDFAFAFAIHRDGRLRLVYSEDGTTVTDIITVERAGSGQSRIAVTLDAATGDVAFYEEDAKGLTEEFDLPYDQWSPLQSYDGTGAVTVFDSSAPVRHSSSGNEDKVGADALDGCARSLWRMRLRDDVEGTDVAYLDIRLIPAEQTWTLETGLPVVGSVTEAARCDFDGAVGETWSIHNYLTSSYPVTIVDRGYVLIGNQSFLQAEIDADFFSAIDGHDFSVWVAFTNGRINDGAGGPLITVKDFSAGADAAGFMLINSTSFPQQPTAILGDGTDHIEASGPATSDGRQVIAGMQIDATAEEVTALVNGIASDPVDYSALSTIHVDGKHLTIGQYSDASVPAASFAFAGAAIFRRRLTEFEAQVILPYELGLTPVIPDQRDPEGGWEDFTLLNSWAAPTPTLAPQWRTNGNHIELRGVLDGTSSSDPVFASFADTTYAPGAGQAYVPTCCTADLSIFSGAAMNVLDDGGGNTDFKGYFQVLKPYLLLDGLTYALT